MLDNKVRIHQSKDALNHTGSVLSYNLDLSILFHILFVQNILKLLLLLSLYSGDDCNVFTFSGKFRHRHVLATGLASIITSVCCGLTSPLSQSPHQNSESVKYLYTNNVSLYVPVNWHDTGLKCWKS